MYFLAFLRHLIVLIARFLLFDVLTEKTAISFLLRMSYRLQLQKYPRVPMCGYQAYVPLTIGFDPRPPGR